MAKLWPCFNLISSVNEAVELSIVNVGVSAIVFEGTFKKGHETLQKILKFI